MKKTNKKGFTLIEVVLTIAIGALIFLMAFLAFGNARTNQRDGQRRADLDKITGEISNYAGDRGGAIPTTENFDTFLQDYYGKATDPSDKTKTYYSIRAGGTANASTPGYVSYTVGGSSATYCDGTEMTSGSAYKVEMKLEKGTACRDSK